MNWQRYFQNHILGRGLTYFIDNRVSFIEKQNDYIRARVSGTEMYEVEAEFENEEVISLECTCPHAAGDNFCKHMAAVLFAYENENKNTSKTQPTQSVEETVKQADENYIRQFLIDLLSEDTSLMKQFVIEQQTAITQMDIDYFKTQLRQIFDNHLYPNGFIDYYHAWDFQSDLERYMTQTIKILLIQNGHYEAAFELINIIIFEIVDLAIDDSEGTLTDIAYECYDLWELIIDSASPDFQGEMFAWFVHTIETKDLDFLEDYIEKILFSHFNEEIYMKKKIELTEKQLKKFKTDKKSWGFRYEFDKWARYYLQTLEPFENMKKEQLTFIKKNLDVESVRKFYVDKLIDSKNYMEAIHLLEEEKSNHYLSEAYHEKLKNLYFKTGEKKAYQKTLYELVCKHGSRRMDLYDEYKALYSEEEWLEKRTSLIQEITGWSGRDGILYKEEMYEELLELAVDAPGLDMIQKYEELFCQMASEKVLDKYENELKEQAIPTAGRKTYRNIAYTIRRMKQLPNSTKRVNELLAYLRATYKNRPAMMDELSYL